MRSPMTVVRGQKVVVSAWNDGIIGIATVKSQSKAGQITVTWNGTEYRYEADGYPKGKASYMLRPLAEGESAEEILANLQAAKDAKIKAQNQVREARQAQQEEELKKCWTWVAERAAVTRQHTVVGDLHIVEMLGTTWMATLVIRFGQAEVSWDKTQYRAEIMVNHDRGDGRVDGGITSAYAAQQDPIEIAAGWVKSWVGSDNL